MVSETAQPTMQGTYRKVVGNRATWYIRTDVLNCADHLYSYDPASDTPKRRPFDAKMRGFGGALILFKLDDGTVEGGTNVWHSNAGGLLKDTGLNIQDLHLTRVVLYSTKVQRNFRPGYERQEGGRLIWKEDLPHDDVVRDEVIYEEKEPVLGEFMRGERIAHAYVAATGKSVYVERYSNGGSSAHLVTPDTEMHPMARDHE